MENLIENTLLKCFERNNFVSKQEYGYINERSTITALPQVVENISEGLDEGRAQFVRYTESVWQLNLRNQFKRTSIWFVKNERKTLQNADFVETHQRTPVWTVCKHHK